MKFNYKIRRKKLCFSLGIFQVLYIRITTYIPICIIIHYLDYSKNTTVPFMVYSFVSQINLYIRGYRKINLAIHNDCFHLPPVVTNTFTDTFSHKSYDIIIIIIL